MGSAVCLAGVVRVGECLGREQYASRRGAPTEGQGEASYKAARAAAAAAVAVSPSLEGWGSWERAGHSSPLLEGQA